MSNPSGFPRRIDHGMVAAYNWQYGGSCPDLTENSNTGTLNGNASTSEGVLTLDGTGDYVDCGTGVDDNLSNGLSLVGWVNPSASGLKVFASNYNGPGAAGQRFGFFCRASTDRLGIVLVDGLIGDRIQIYKSSLALSGWQFVAYVWDGSTSASGLKIYLNGSELTSTTDASSGTFTGLSQSPVPLKIGTTNNFSGLAEYFNGQIGSTRIYNRALSATEISELYRSTVRDYIPAASTTGLEAWYRWNGNANDVLGVNDGTLVGDASATAGLLTLDGTGDYVSASSPFSSPSALSVCMWFKKTSVATTEMLWTAEDSGGAAGQGLRFYYVTGLGIVFDSYVSGDEKVNLVSTSDISAGVWYHFAISLSGANSTMYVNGVADNTSTSQKHSHTYDLAKVGRWYQSTGFDWDGDVGEARYYNRALSATEISTIYNDTRGDYA